jgi:hypothetical protein
MPNHFHLIASTPLANLDKCMNYFMSHTSKIINNEAKRINQLHGGRHFKSLITSLHYAHHVYKYVYRNPVKAKLCQKVEEYPFSSIRMFLGLNGFQLPLEADEMLMNDIDDTLKWLNETPDDDEWTQIRRGLKHAEFYLPVDKISRKPSRLEDGKF